MQRRLLLIMFFVHLVLVGGPLSVLAAPNPVLPRTADCGVLRFGGNYYLMGVWTDGSVYISNDLVEWSGPVKAFHMDNRWTWDDAATDGQIHACDFKLHHGVFHLYWSVNFFSDTGDTLLDIRAIGHATADEPDGPYAEPITQRPFNENIDPHVFVDWDGKPYAYCVKFNKGNVIWGQRMDATLTRIGHPWQMLFAIPDTWEVGNEGIWVNEAAWVTRLGDHYYMLYNSNHTAEFFGHYAIGVAVADDPMGFNNENKYPHPVLTDNRARILSEAEVLIPPALGEGTVWRMTTEDPGVEWPTPDFDDSAWIEASGAFGSLDQGMDRGVLRTDWKASEIWLRKTFRLEKAPGPNTQILINHERDAEVYLNGVQAVARPGRTGGYAAVDPTPVSIATLQPGENVIAVHCKGSGAKQYIDVALIDPGDRPGETIVTNPGQPNVVRGPNGLEWWLVYFAIYNGDPERAQAVDRLYFFGDELVVDGPTTEHTPGYHPRPCPPTYFCALNDNDFDPEQQWDIRGDDFETTTDTLRLISVTTETVALPDIPQASHYLAEVSVKLGKERKGEVGFVVDQARNGAFLHFGLDTEAQALVIRQAENVLQSIPVEAGLIASGWHMLRLEINGPRMEFWIDDVLATSPTLELEVARAGLPGLYVQGTAVNFKGFTYTRGWEEIGESIAGWDTTSEDIGEWSTTPAGLQVIPEPGRQTVRLKGDRLAEYEIAVQVKPETMGAAPVGILAAYVDEDNFMAVVWEPAGETISIFGEIAGEAVAEISVAVPQRQPRRYSLAENGLNLRAVRQEGELLILADGELVYREALDLPASQIGLLATQPCTFDAITLFDRSKATD